MGVMEATTYMSLDALAARLGLPRGFLRDQARRGTIPHLLAGGRLRFEESAVREALRQQSAKMVRPPGDTLSGRVGARHV
jgi:excisionase family DNA binding protein